MRANGYCSGHAWLHVPGVVVDGAVRTGVGVVALANDLHSVDRVGLDLLTTLGTWVCCVMTLMLHEFRLPVPGLSPELRSAAGRWGRRRGVSPRGDSA